MNSPQLLTCVSGERFPSQILCVDCEGEWLADPGRPARQLEQLVSWHAIGFSGAGGKYGADHYEEGTDVETFWDRLAHRLRKGGAMWALSENAARVWTLLGLWQRLERGAWRLTGEDSHADIDGRNSGLPRLRSGSGGAGRDAPGVPATGLPQLRRGGEGGVSRSPAQGKPGRPAQVGYCAIDGGTFGIAVKPAGGPGSVTIGQLENYGLTRSPLGTSARQRAWRCGAFIRGAVSLLKANNLGSLQRTASSQAMHGFRRGYLQHIIVKHTHDAATELEAAAYYGGRCEAFRLGAIPGPVYHLDVVAAYAAVCATENVPVRLMGYERECPWNVCQELMQEYACIAEVTIQTEERDYPYRDERLGITVWPVGRFRTCLAHPELADALQRGRIVGWHRIAWYKTAPALQAFGRRMLDLRSELPAGSDLRAFAKHLPNCLVGKFGQRDRRWENARSNACVGAWEVWWQRNGEAEWQRWRSVAGATQREIVGSFAWNAVPAIAAYVTSSQRTRLTLMIRCAGTSSVHYTDTDSLMVTVAGAGKLEDGGYVGRGAPGLLSLKRRSESLYIHGIKQYVEDGIPVMAGMPIDPALVDRETGQIYRSATVGSACRAGHAPLASRSAGPWTHAGIYRHGRRDKDGVVWPLRYDER